MTEEILTKTVKRLLTKPKGILAIDESLPTCNKRFEALGIATTLENRRKYREMLVSAPEIEKYVSGYILFDETLRQSAGDGCTFTSILQKKGIEVGIKVDTGTKDLEKDSLEKTTEGIDGLEDRLKEYKALGATFAKWRAVYTISSTTPTAVLIKKNAELFAKYATLCQEAGIVPIVEPEVLMDGNHTLEECYEVTAKNLRVVFDELKEAKVFLPGMILKTNMILPGQDLDLEVYTSEIAKMTVKCLKENVPEDIGGIVFLSGGQDDEDATVRLNSMHNLGPLPWPLTFSYGRAIQNLALRAWAKHPEDVGTAQALLVDAARNNSLASVGEYKK